MMALSSVRRKYLRSVSTLFDKKSKSSANVHGATIQWTCMSSWSWSRR